MQQDPTPTRRSVVTAGSAAALGVVATGALAACGGADSSTGATATPSTTSSSAAPSASASASGSAGEVAEAALAELADVPVGGAIALEAAGGALIVAQPTAGNVVAYSAVCPHQGCAVAPRQDRLVCPCHGSAFEAATGKVLNGPATKDLTPVTVRVQGTSIVAG